MILKMYRGRKSRSWTTVKSQAQMSLEWFLIKVDQDWLDFLRPFERYLWTVCLLRRMPSLSNSPRIRSAPHRWFSLAIFFIRAIVLGETQGFFVFEFDFHRQKKRNRLRCQRSNVSDCMMKMVCFQNPVHRAKRINKSRSLFDNWGRLSCLFRMINCWRSKAFSAIKSARDLVELDNEPRAMLRTDGFVRNLILS